MDLKQFKNIFAGRQIKYSELSMFLNSNVQLKKQLECLYDDYSDRFGFRAFVKYFIQNKVDNRCKKCGKLLTYKQIKDNRIYCSNKCSNSDQLVKEKIRQTNVQRYGVVSATKLPSVVEKMKKTNFEKYGFEWSSQRFKKVKDFSDGKCVECKNDDSIYQQQLFYNDIDYAKIIEQIYQFLKKQTNQECLINCDNYVMGQTFDICCPNKNIVCQLIETRCQLPRIYNVSKIAKCDQRGIRILHILPDQWVNRKQLVKDRINSVLGVFEKKIFARKCVVREVGVLQCRSFLDLNHIQGADLSKIKLGLYFENELVSVMTFGKPRFNQEYQWQLIRYASKLGSQVIGGAGKLLKHFEKKYNPKSIISYADRRYSNGKLYYALDFCFLENSKPNYWWVKNNQKLSRYRCQKHKLHKLLGDKFVSQLSQNLNMKNNGYVKVYDCGNMVFEKKYC